MKIKAYEWDDEYRDESHVVWAATPGKAKALLASEYDREFTEIRVYRVPWADQYRSMDDIPAEEFLKNGWYLCCVKCGTHVYDDTAVLTENKVLCVECAKDWSKEKIKKEDL